MQDNTGKHADFNPCELFPARIKGKVFKAIPTVPDGSGVRGATNLKKNEVSLPMANNAYDRTVRLHEALHAIYSKKRMKPEDCTMLGQGLEDARLHLNCAKTSGHVRRDEIATALIDIKRGSPGDSNLAALLALRSAAILNGDRRTLRAKTLFDRLCNQVAPDYQDKVREALIHIAANDMLKAREVLTPYFTDGTPPPQMFPSAGKGAAEAPKGTFTDTSFSFEKMEGKLTSDAAEMLCNTTINSINDSKRMPKLYIRPLYASHMIPTFFGETQKHVMAGCKIHAKKLATIVGPQTPKIFLKTIRRNGGTVLIDASGSMSISPEQLLRLITHAPAATIAFYNALDDSSHFGNLWIFCHKGKRALDFREVNLGHKSADRYVMEGTVFKRNEKGRVMHRQDVFGSGNVVDFQAIQWLLTQSGPRYMLTDGQFTGPEVSKYAGKELLRTAIARKKITQIRSLPEMENVLAKGEITA